MNKWRLYVWLVGAGIVFGTILIRPQYAEEAAKAVKILVGEEICICE